MNIQIQDLREENSRLSDALRDLAVQVADNAASARFLSVGDVIDSTYSSITGSKLSGTGTGTGTISQALLLRQLDCIQNQLDAAKKQAQVMGIVRRSSFTKPNPILADSLRAVNAPLSVTFGRTRSLSNLPSPSLSSSLNQMSYPSPTYASIGVCLPSHDASLRRPSKVLRDLLDIDSDAERVENSGKFWDLSNFKDDHFTSISKVASEPAEKTKKLSPRFADADEGGLFLAANRCKDSAQRNPVISDLSTALDKYLNVVRKLSASAARMDTRSPDIDECEEIVLSLTHGLQRSTISNNNDIKNNAAQSTLHTESNRDLGVRDKQTAWRASEDVKTSPESTLYLGSNECKLVQ
jgi:hypothetical protein